MSKVATPSDEALTLLIIENNERRWTDAHELMQKGATGSSLQLGPTRYTSAGRNGKKKGFTRKYSGWNAEGIKRFNEILDMVRMDRQLNQKWFDEIWVNHVKNKQCKNDEDDEKWDNSGKNATTWIQAGNDLCFDEESNKEGGEDGLNSGSDDDDEVVNKVGI